MRRLAAGAVIVGALVPAGAGAATACDGGHHDGTRGVSFTVRHHMRDHGALAVASSYLGLSREVIKSQLHQGKSLAEIADATTGKSAQGLVDAYTAAIKVKLDKKVAAGWISAAKEQDVLTKIQPWLVRLVNAHWDHH
jgi:hypothetical protein